MINNIDTDTDLGKSIRKMREAKGMSRAALAERVGISDSHLKKIESGSRKPGIDTYQKILNALGACIVIEDNEDKCIKGSCIRKVRTILMNCSDKQALFLVNLLELLERCLQAAGLC